MVSSSLTLTRDDRPCNPNTAFLWVAEMTTLDEMSGAEVRGTSPETTATTKLLPPAVPGSAFAGGVGPGKPVSGSWSC